MQFLVGTELGRTSFPSYIEIWNTMEHVKKRKVTKVLCTNGIVNSYNTKYNIINAEATLNALLSHSLWLRCINSDTSIREYTVLLGILGETAHEAVATSNEVPFNAYPHIDSMDVYRHTGVFVACCMLQYTHYVFVKRRMTGINVHIEDRLTGACVFEIEYLRSLTVCLIRTIIY